MERKLVTFSNFGNKEDNLNDAVTKIEAAGEGRTPIMIIYTSDQRDFAWYTQSLYERFPNSEVIGSATCITFASEGFAKYGLATMVIYEGIKVAAGVLLDVATYPMSHYEEIQAQYDAFGEYENTICMEFTTYNDLCEELVLDTLGRALEHHPIPMMGSSSGMEDYEGPSMVGYNGVAYDSGCVYSFIHNERGRIVLYKENMFRATERIVSATDVDCDNRTVYEFDGKPALKAMEEVYNVSGQVLKDSILNHPLGRIGREGIFIISPRSINEDGSISFYARIFNHTKMAVLELDNLEQIWRQTYEEIMKNGFVPDFSVIVNCASRTEMFMEYGRFQFFYSKIAEEYGSYIGVSGFGEQLNYAHLNLTMTMALFE